MKAGVFSRIQCPLCGGKLELMEIPGGRGTKPRFTIACMGEHCEARAMGIGAETAKAVEALWLSGLRGPCYPAALAGMNALDRLLASSPTPKNGTKGLWTPLDREA